MPGRGKKAQLKAGPGNAAGAKQRGNGKRVDRRVTLTKADHKAKGKGKDKKGKGTSRKQKRGRGKGFGNDRHQPGEDASEGGAGAPSREE